MTKAKILAALGKLSKADLKAVRAAADSLLGPQAAATDGPATPLLDVIQRTLGLRIGWQAFTAATTYKPYVRGEAAVAQFVAEAFPTMLDNKINHNAMLGLIVDCLVDDLKERKVPISLGSVCDNLERAPQCVKAAFPGYIEGGLTYLITNYITRNAK